MTKLFRLLITALLLAGGVEAAQWEWSNDNPIPNELGVAGPIAGISNGVLLVAGGANFPEGKPWEGGTKIWHQDVFALDKPGGTWRKAGSLPEAIGYGVSLTVKEGIFCAGGSDATRHSDKCYVMVWTESGVEYRPLPSLPLPLANAAGAVLGRTVFLSGGTVAPDSTEASRDLFLFDLDHPEAGWKKGDPLPGPGRILPVAAVQSGSFFVMGGASLSADPEGKAKRTYLTDGWCYTPGAGWKPMADLPHPVVAAPSPAPPIGQSHFLIAGGDDGSLTGFSPIEKHPGFPGRMLTYDTITNTWAERGVMPMAVVTTPAVWWNDRFVFPSGEIRPGIRTPGVQTLVISPDKASFGWVNWMVVTVYLGGMVMVGWWFMKRDASSTTEAYFRGGQKIPVWVAGLSIFATMLSSLTFMGIPARAFQTDMSWYIGQMTLLLVTPLVVFCYLPFFRKLNVTSAYEYLEKRFSLPVRLFGSLSFMLFHVGRIAIVLYLPALALAAVSDIGVVPSIVLIGILCLIYTVMGGITAVVWTDAIQAVILLLGAATCLVLAIFQMDNPGAFWEVAGRDDKLFESLRWDNFNFFEGTTTAVVLFVAFFFNTLVPYTSGQDVVQRYVTTKDLPTARKSLWINMVMSLGGALLFFLLGAALYVFFKTNPGELDPGLQRTDSILPYFIMKELPVGFSGLVIAAIFAASQSTISSSLNSAATAYSKDFDARIFRPGRSDRDYLRGAMVVVLVMGILGIGVAVWMASSGMDSAFKAFNELIGLTAGSLGGLFALGIFSRRAHAGGALVGALAGFATVLMVKLYFPQISGLLYAFIGCGTCFIIGWLISQILPGRAAAEWSYFSKNTNESS